MGILDPNRSTLASISRDASDHGVSEAFYLRPKEATPLTLDGSLEMFTRPLDLEALLIEAPSVGP